MGCDSIPKNGLKYTVRLAIGLPYGWFRRLFCSLIPIQVHFYLGMLIQLQPKTGLVAVVGAGPVGQRKVRKLVDHGFRVRWVLGAADLRSAASDLVGLMRGSLVEHQLFDQNFEIKHLDDIKLLILAANDEVLHQRITREAHRRNILVNDTLSYDTNPGEKGCENHSDFTLVADFPLAQGVSLGIGTQGLAPGMARDFIRGLASEIPKDWRSAWSMVDSVSREKLHALYKRNNGSTNWTEQGINWLSRLAEANEHNPSGKEAGR